MFNVNFENEMTFDQNQIATNRCTHTYVHRLICQQSSFIQYLLVFIERFMRT